MDERYWDMNGKKWIVSLAAAALLAGSAVAPASAQSSRQKDKNNMRNLGIGLGAAAAYEGLRGHGTNALLLGAGAVYSAKKYEDARKAQSKENATRRRYVYRNGRRVGYYKIRNGRRVGYVRLAG
jgi:hypothetical protein